MKKSLLTFLIYINLYSQVIAAPFPDPFPVAFLVILEQALSLVPAIVTLIFIGMFFWGGFVWMTAGDSDDKVTKARSILFSALIGLLFVFLARPILLFLGTFFGTNEPIINS